MAGLSEAAQTIGSIVETIRAVAEQTNLLALNATIEAARAGEAGKGFAVVASEVKTLAAQTAKATEQIAGQISAVQNSTRTAVDSLRGIAGKVEEINSLTGAIAAAVEQQDAATREIASNVSRAADESKQAAENASSVTEAAARTRSESTSLTSASEQFATASRSIASSVKGFLDAIAVDLDDRRSASRSAYNWVIVVMRDGRRFEARAHDISTAGLRIERMSGLAVGDKVQIDFGQGQGSHASEVIWVDQGGIGLKFDRPLAQVPRGGAAAGRAKAA